ncbi:LacI family DNA-binding transcriptional regulator [Labrys wisconsinensis]|uniref:LacI family gluconate utilization system Gnt-I transcriptional repressor n=1 Tax=Labrys wisconsinensis TaxID=425677 RepID=A0ABU0JK08_9HYPH|nr:LacI family DNA-binding transcriptional regulator [Labrys wisconsinensis]MDQ0473594.1 LacI family gluconate utilization system Gnt-I transcriptional repressor [Labrys wisconsinensis]
MRLIDVARSAGVSTMTASRVMRGEPTVAVASRDAVHAAAARLGYVPNQVAGSLRSQRSGIIAVIVPTLTGSVFAETVRGITDTFDAYDYQLMIGESSYDIEREEKVIAALVQRRPDAIIIAGVKHTPQARSLLRSAGVPVAEIWDQTTHPIDIIVGFSNFQAAYDMTRGLLDKGYRRLALATGPVIPGNRAGERTEGYLAALKDAGIHPGPSIVVPYYNFLDSSLKGGNVVADFLRDNSSIDCLFCTNELIAIGAVVACGRRGVKVPGDVAIAGFGDVEAASIITPDLTTVKIRGFEMGRRAAEILARRLLGETSEPEIVDVGYELKWRSSA